MSEELSLIGKSSIKGAYTITLVSLVFFAISFTILLVPIILYFRNTQLNFDSIKQVFKDHPWIWAPVGLAILASLILVISLIYLIIKASTRVPVRIILSKETKELLSKKLVPNTTPVDPLTNYLLIRAMAVISDMRIGYRARKGSVLTVINFFEKQGYDIPKSVAEFAATQDNTVASDEMLDEIEFLFIDYLKSGKVNLDIANLKFIIKMLAKKYKNKLDVIGGKSLVGQYTNIIDTINNFSKEIKKGFRVDELYGYKENKPPIDYLGVKLNPRQKWTDKEALKIYRKLSKELKSYINGLYKYLNLKMYIRMV